MTQDNQQVHKNTVTINGKTRPLTEFEATILELCSTFNKYERQKLLKVVYDIIVHSDTVSEV